MKHKRKLLVFFLSLLACLFLSACQSAKTPSKDTTQDSGSKECQNVYPSHERCKKHGICQ